MHVIDVGGGLGIYYDGSKSGGSDISVGYPLGEYSCAMVHIVQYIYDRKKVRHPIICSENGHALISYHSVLVFEAIPSTTTESSIVPNIGYLMEGLADEALYNEYINLSSAVVRGDYNSCFAHSENLKVKCVDMFKDGLRGLEQLASVDGWCYFVFKEVGASVPVTTYNINLSIFTSVPDFWAIGRLFPILPIHHLDEKPNMNGVISDLTCDSDGRAQGKLDHWSSESVSDEDDGIDWDLMRGLTM